MPSARMTALRPGGVVDPATEAGGPPAGPRERSDAEARPRARDPRPGFERRRVSKLTIRVLAVNILALALLFSGFLYLGRYRDTLIEAELAALRTESLIFAGGLAEGAVVGDPINPEGLDVDLARPLARRLYEATDNRTRVFDLTGDLLVDSRVLGGPTGGLIEVLRLPAPQTRSWFRRAFNSAYDWVRSLFPTDPRYPIYREPDLQRASDFAPVVSALSGEVATQVWARERSNELVLGVAVPVQRLRVVIGAVLVTRDSGDIEQTVQSVREDLLVVFAGALAITTMLSLYLAGTITRPIRRLALAAKRMQRARGEHQEIPDLSHRRDEIGELSSALRDMTAALWARMDAIERFAADVAHEIKNPLTSLRSAVETIGRVKDPEQQQRLVAIITEDVSRLDRLITDISDASRLDAELSRAESERVDVGEMLEMLRDLYAGPAADQQVEIVVEAPDQPLFVQGLESRLVQVLRNLLTNALSFSPEGGRIRLAARRERGRARITVGDDGPGIPPNKLQAIFDRFYSERPTTEKFGTHSGLGLSISKQIIEAHKGEIFAENRLAEDGETVLGARFTILVPIAP